jgi:hypothetical protein
MPDGFHNVASASLALGTNHRSALRNAPQSLAQIAAAVDERNLEVVLVYMMDVVSWSENLQINRAS